MNNFSTNFNEIVLLCNLPLEIMSDNKLYVFHLPTIEQMNSEKNKMVISLFVYELEKLQKIFNINSLNRYGLVVTLLKNKEFFDTYKNVFKIFIEEFEFTENSMYCGDNAMLTDIFDLFCDCVQIACGYKDFKSIQQQIDLSKLSPEEREFEKRKREYEALIQRTKNKARDQKDGKGSSSNFTSIMMLCISREFGVTLEEQKKMNMYTFNMYIKQIGKIARYNVDVIATGNGMLKKGHKHLYWTEL